MKPIKFFLASLMTSVILLNACTGAQAALITQGKKVQFHYKLYVNKQLIDSTENKAPLAFVYGDGTIIPELARQMRGLKTGDKKAIFIKADQAYGQPNPEAFREIPKTLLPKGMKPQEGQVFQFTAENGSQLPGMVWKVNAHTVLINLNHPLAGQDLTFEIEIVSIE